jgi:CubicO group peptidase (beta-lactamase class C family)
MEDATLKKNHCPIAALVGTIGLGLILLSGCATAREPQGSTANPALAERGRALASLDAYIESEMKRIKAPGLGITIVSGGAAILEKGYGFANREAGKKVDADTIFNVGSVSKLFTNAAIMKLVEAGKVDLDAPVTTYIPELSLKTRGSSFSDVTVRSMLTHHSGMPSDLARNFFFGQTAPANHTTAFRSLPMDLEGSYVATAPGTIFSYSNLSFSLLGIVIERASGMSFEDYVQEAVLKPLGMDSSSFNFKPLLSGRYSKGYLGGKQPVNMPAIRDIPAGQLSSSAHDMSLFLEAALASARGGDGLLRPGTMKAVLTQQNANVPLDFDFRIGLTWWLMDIPELPGLVVAGHGGDLPPFHSLILIVPEKDVGVEINVNNAEGAGSLELRNIAVRALRTAIALKDGGESLAPGARTSADGTPGGAASRVAPLPAVYDSSVDGWYSSGIGMLKIRHAGNALKLELSGHQLDVVYHEDGRFTLGYKLVGLIPIDIPMLRTVTFRMPEYQGKRWIAFSLSDIPFGVGEKLTPEPIDRAWMARVGKYAIRNPDQGKAFGNFAIRFDKPSGFLMLDMTELGGAVSVPIRPIGRDEFVTWGMGRSMNETGIFAPDGSSGETLEFSGFRLKQ